MLDNTTVAIHAQALLPRGPFVPWIQNQVVPEVEHTSSASATGRTSEALIWMLDNSGRHPRFALQFTPSMNQAAIKLLQQWIDEYGATCDPNLDQQLEELRKNRLSLRVP
ncbi:MAG: hypothetical protein WEB85_16355 [Dongiaceae bacterium]